MYDAYRIKFSLIFPTVRAAIAVLLVPLSIQTFYAQGLLFDDRGYQESQTLPDYGDDAKNATDAAEGIYKMDLKPYCPTPQDQGFIASCTGWASGYGALTISRAIAEGWTGQTEKITQHAYSALFIYNQIKKGSCEFGAYISDAVDLLKTQGDVHSRDFDLIKNNCDKMPKPELREKAADVRIKDYLALFSKDDSPGVKTSKVKQALLQQKPVIIGFTLLQNFRDMRPGLDTWYPEMGDDSPIGGHAMVVVGFDDGKGAFEIMNSWGPRWANDGFAWIRYRDFEKYCQYAYIIIQGDDTSYKDFRARIVLRKPRYDDEDMLHFDDMPVRYENGYYKLENGILEAQGDYIQPVLELDEMTGEVYFYAFSFDALGNINVHWPRDEKLNARFEGKHESAYISSTSMRLHLPGTYSALSFPVRGIEYLCFLIASNPINDLNHRLEALPGMQGRGFNERIQTGFKDILLAPENFEHQSDDITVHAAMQAGKVLPVTVRFEIR